MTMKMTALFLMKLMREMVFGPWWNGLRNIPSPNQTTLLFPSLKPCTTSGLPWSGRSWLDKPISWQESKPESSFSGPRHIWELETKKQKTKNTEVELFKLTTFFFQNSLTGEHASPHPEEMCKRQREIIYSMKSSLKWKQKTKKM